MFKYNLEKKLKRSATTMLYSPRAYIHVKVDNRVQYQRVSTNASHKKGQGEGLIDTRKGVIDCGSNIIIAVHSFDQSFK